MFDVVQVIVVGVYAVTAHDLLSIVTVVVAVSEKLVPVKVTLSLPRTEPKRVLIEVRTGVLVFEKVTGLKSVATPSNMSFGVHA